MEKYLRTIASIVLLLSMPLAVVPQPAAAQQGSPTFVLVVMRHGVRSPTHPAELAPYTTRTWPSWEVKPGYLTPHGAALIRQFGTYYRRMYQAAGVFPEAGCPARGSVFVWADIDERTIATGNALLDGLARGCGFEVGHGPLGKDDPLFDPLPTLGKANVELSRASAAGAIGNDPNALVPAYASVYNLLDRVLGCTAPTNGCKPLSHVPTTLDSDPDNGLISVNGGLDSAGTAAENLLLAYSDGKTDPAWRQVDAKVVTQLMQLHALKSRIEHETWYNARAEGSNILTAITATLDQAASGTKNPNTRIPESTRFAAISGHDTTLSLLAGTLHLSWLMPGYQLNDTPPGGALVFEVHRTSGSASVRLFFTAQSLEQMHRGDGSQPSRVAVYIPGCPSMDCPIETFDSIVKAAVNERFVTPWHD